MHQKPIFFNRALRCEAGVSNITFFIFFMNDLFENKSVNDTAVVTVNQINQFSCQVSLNSSVVPRSRFLLDTGIPPTEFQALPEFQPVQSCQVSLNSSVVPRSRFLLDTGIPPTEFQAISFENSYQALPEFQGDTYKFWGTHQILKNFTY